MFEEVLLLFLVLFWKFFGFFGILILFGFLFVLLGKKLNDNKMNIVYNYDCYYVEIYFVNKCLEF